MSTTTGRAPSGAPSVDELGELEQERRFLLRSLDDLEREHDAGDVDPADYTALKDGYTARAAAVLRAIEAGRSALPPKAPVRWGRVALVSLASIVIAVLAGVGLAKAVGQRTPSDSATGSISASTNTKLAEARALLGTNQVESLKRYVDVLKVEPDNREALAYRGWLLVQLGVNNNRPDFVTQGRSSIDQAVKSAATYADARFFAGWVKYRLDKDAVGALSDWDVFLANNPPAELKAAVAALYAEAKASTGTPAPATTVG